MGITPKKPTVARKIIGLSRGERNAKWIEDHCYVPEGKFVGRKVKLTVKQKKWLVRIYDSPTRTFILSMGRKNAKTAFAAFLLLLHLCGPEARRNSSLLSAAQSREQAGILFSLAAKMVRMSPELMAVISIKESQKILTCDELGTLYRALSAEVSTSFGLSPAFIVHDELGQVKGPKSELYDALESASAAQEEPLSIIISTQAPTDADLLSLLIDDALTGADSRVKVELYTCPVKVPGKDKNGQAIEIEVDPFLESSIRLANPHFDDFMNQEEVFRQRDTARRMPSSENSYRNLILNQRVDSKTPFISRAVWLENGSPPDPFDGRPVYGGLDLSSVADLTGLVLGTEEGDIECEFWLPEDGIEEKSKKDHVPYDVWAKKGFLHLTPGRAIEYEFIAVRLREIFDTYNIAFIAFDRYNMKHLIPWLKSAGFTEDEIEEKFVLFGQGFVSMSPAIRELEQRLLQKKIKHGGHPVLTMCAANTVTVEDPAKNRKFVKQKATGRIDGMVCLAMCVGVMPNASDDADFADFLSNPVRL